MGEQIEDIFSRIEDNLVFKITMIACILEIVVSIGWIIISFIAIIFAARNKTFNALLQKR